jgi:hypothetical protein
MMLVAIDTTPAAVLITVSQNTIKSFVLSSTPETVAVEEAATV